MLTAKGVLTGSSVAGCCALGRPLAVLPTAFSLFRVAPTSYPIDSALSRHVCLCGSVNPGGGTSCLGPFVCSELWCAISFKIPTSYFSH